MSSLPESNPSPPRSGIGQAASNWPLRALCWACCLLVALTPTIVQAEGWLEMIREDVRTPSPAATTSESDYLATCDYDDKHLGESVSGYSVG